MKHNHVTIYDVAKDAGVSPATVSRVLSGSASVKRQTIELVNASIFKLGYRPNRKVYPFQPGDLILLVIPSFSNPYYSAVVRGVKQSVQRHGLQLLICDNQFTSEEMPKFLELIKHVKAKGLISCSFIPKSAYERLSKIIPLVQCGEYNDDLNLPYVSVDDIQASIDVMHYLSSIGKQRIAFLNGPAELKFSRNRLQGYITALAQKGVDYDASLIMNIPEVNCDVATSMVLQMLDTAPIPDAFFAVSDVFALSAVRASQLRGLNVPGDIAVVGFDDIEISSSVIPSITTVSQPREQMGYTACELLIERLINPYIQAKRIILKTQLIVRESTAV